MFARTHRKGEGTADADLAVRHTASSPPPAFGPSMTGDHDFEACIFHCIIHGPAARMWVQGRGEEAPRPCQPRLHPRIPTPRCGAQTLPVSRHDTHRHEH